jgi:hypothetical protein
MQASMSFQKALSALSVHLKAFSFFVSSVSGIAIFKKSLMNYRLKLTNPIKAYISLTVVSVS